MNLTVTAVNFNATDKLETFIDSKLSKLAQYYDAIIGAEVFLKAQKTQTSDHKLKIVKIKIEIPGSDLFAEKQANTFEEATDLATEALRRQIKKHKEKLRNL